MRKLIHFPLRSDTFSHQFGIKSLDKKNQITKKTDCYKDEISLKNDLIKTDQDYYSISTNRSIKSEEEASILLINKRNRLLETAKSLQEDSTSRAPRSETKPTFDQENAGLQVFD